MPKKENQIQSSKVQIITVQRHGCLLWNSAINRLSGALDKNCYHIIIKVQIDDFRKTDFNRNFTA